MSVYAAQASFFIIMAAFPFFMVLLALIQVAPMIHEADLLRFLLPAIPDRFRGLLIYLLDVTPNTRFKPFSIPSIPFAADQTAARAVTEISAAGESECRLSRR